MKSQSFQRRQFLKRFGSGLLFAGAAPSLLPFISRAADSPSANSQISVGCIGVGERCQIILDSLLQHKECRVRSICDVKTDALDRTKNRINSAYKSTDCQTYRDFRETVQRKDIDAFVIASTDHWHVLHALAAVRAGKDVYVEKPLGLSLEEDQVLRREVRAKNRVFQFGTQQRSDRKFRVACELVRNGHIGKLKHINVWAPGSKPVGVMKEVPPPATLDYDFWLGPAPQKAYTEHLTDWDYRSKTWWFNSDYTLGFLSGWGIHPLDIALWGAGNAASGQVEIQGHGKYPAEGVCDTATFWDLNFKFATGLTMRFIAVPNEAPGEVFTPEKEWTTRYGRLESHGTVFEGSNGWVHVDRSQINLHPENLIDIDPASFKTQLTKSSDHVGNFLDSINSRKPPVAPIEDAVRADMVCHIADITLRQQRKLTFDFDSEKFIDAPEPGRLLNSRAMRKPWKLEA